MRFLSQSQDFHTELHQVNQIERFWYQIKEENFVFQMVQKMFKSIEFMDNYSQNELVYGFFKKFLIHKQ